MRKYLAVILLLFCSGVFSQGIYKKAALAGLAGGPDNVYDLSNAADPEDEQNNTSGTDTESVEVTWQSSTTQASDGTYSLRLYFNQAGTGNDRGRIQLSGLTIGATYTVEFDFYEDNSNWTVRFETFQGWQVQSVENNFTNDVWETRTVTGLEPTQTDPYIRIQSPSNSTSGWQVFIDNIKVYKTADP